MACFGYLCGPKIGKSSSYRNRTYVTTVLTDLKDSPYLRSYISACQENSNLKSFDSLLRQRTTSVIDSLAAHQSESQSLSLDSLIEVYGFVLELNEDAVRVIIESEEHVWKSKDLRSLLDVYFESTAKTLDFFNTVENCVKRADIMRLIIRLAEKQFEKESVDTELEGNMKKKYSETLGELNKFKAIGDPFGDEFMTQYQSVFKQQVLPLNELHNLIVRLDRKQRNVQIWRTLSNVFFGTAFASILVLSVVLAAMSAVPVVGAVASALTTPIEKVGSWFSETLKAYENAVGRQKDLVILMEARAKVNNEATRTISIQVENLRIRISSIMETVDVAVEEREDGTAMTLAMQDIMKKVEGFTEKIEQVGANADNCRKSIVAGRILVLKHINELPTNGGS